MHEAVLKCFRWQGFLLAELVHSMQKQRRAEYAEEEGSDTDFGGTHSKINRLPLDVRLILVVQTRRLPELVLVSAQS